MVTQKDWSLTFETCKRNFCESRARARVCVDKSISKSVKDAMQKNNNPNERVETEVFLCSDRFPTQPALRAREQEKNSSKRTKTAAAEKGRRKSFAFFFAFSVPNETAEPFSNAETITGIGLNAKRTGPRWHYGEVSHVVPKVCRAAEEEEDESLNRPARRNLINSRKKSFSIITTTTTTTKWSERRWMMDHEWGKRRRLDNPL